MTEIAFIATGTNYVPVAECQLWRYSMKIMLMANLCIACMSISALAEEAVLKPKQSGEVGKIEALSEKAESALQDGDVGLAAAHYRILKNSEKEFERMHEVLKALLTQHEDLAAQAKSLAMESQDDPTKYDFYTRQFTLLRAKAQGIRDKIDQLDDSSTKLHEAVNSLENNPLLKQHLEIEVLMKRVDAKVKEAESISIPGEE